MMVNLITLLSEDNEPVLVHNDSIRLSGYLFQLLENQSSPMQVKLNYPQEVLMICCAFLYEFADKEPAGISIINDHDVDYVILKAWYHEYFDSISNTNLFKVLKLSDELEIYSLRNLLMHKIAYFLKGKSKKEIDQYFTFETDLSGKEYEEIVERD